MEVKWRSKRGRIDTAMAYSKNMGKNRVVCKKDPQSVENCDREPPPTLKVLQWNAPFMKIKLRYLFNDPVVIPDKILPPIDTFLYF